jgi:Fic family protein
MGNLELFLNDKYGKTPALLKAAISHVQFETIHPFLDGNGRLGRLLITLILCAEGLISQPILYFSLYFKKHRKTYYDLLNSVRLDGRWEVWVEFFLDAVIKTAEEAIKSTARIGKLFAKDIAKIETLGRAKPTALKVFAYLQKKPICSIQVATEALSLTQPSVTNALLNLQKLGIVKEISGRKRSRVFVYDKYLEILKEGT